MFSFLSFLIFPEVFDSLILCQLINNPLTHEAGVQMIMLPVASNLVNKTAQSNHNQTDIATYT